MRTSTTIVVGCLSVFAATACGMLGGGGLESAECKAYFEKVEACAEKADDMTADILRKTAETSKENFKKNSNALAVRKSCEMMLESLETGPHCKGE